MTGGRRIWRNPRCKLQWDRADKIPRNRGIHLSSLRNPDPPRYIGRIIPLLEFDCSFNNWTFKSHFKSRFCSFSLILNRSGPSWYSMTFWVVRKFDCFRKWQGPLSRKAKVILTALDHGSKKRSYGFFQEENLIKNHLRLDLNLISIKICAYLKWRICKRKIRCPAKIHMQEKIARELSKGVLFCCGARLPTRSVKSKS